MTTEYRADYFTDYQPTDFYELLKVQPGASKQAIDSAYRRLAWQYHPDHNPSAEATNRMQQINAAYSILKDSRRRLAYEQELLYDTAEYNNYQADYASGYRPENYSSTRSRRGGMALHTKLEWLAVLITVLVIGGALWLNNPVAPAVNDTPVTGLTHKNIVSNYPAPVLQTLYYADFEGASETGWKLGAGWNLTTRQAFSGKTSLWVGTETNRPTQDSTAELLRPIDLTSISYPVLQFRINGQTAQNPGEPAQGRLLVEIAESGQSFQPAFEAQGTYTQWEAVSLDLAKFKGAEISLRFHFIGGPGKNITNNSGYFLDDVRLENALPGR